MIKKYRSRYGLIIKKCPGLPEYWHRGELIARGSSICSPDPEQKPTSDDWKYCYSMIEKREAVK